MESISAVTRRLVLHPAFFVGLVIKLALICYVRPIAAEIWYVPFIGASLDQLSLDPWGTFIGNGGRVDAFPYGYVMLLIFLPLSGLLDGLGLDAYYGYSLTLLSVDMALLILLKVFLQLRDRLLVFGYWLSPIVIFATYWLGFNDLLPVALLCLGLYCLRIHKAFWSGVICGAAISAKLSMILPIPFVMIYLFRNHALRPQLIRFCNGLFLSVGILCLPMIFSDAGILMVLKNPEMAKTLGYSLRFGSYAEVYLLPITYLGMLYIGWQVRRITFELFYATMSIAFLLVVIFTPAAPGWFVWFIPLVLTYLAKGKLVDHALFIGLSGIYIMLVFLTAAQPKVTDATYMSEASGFLAAVVGDKGINLINTVLLAFGLVLVARIWRGAISENDYFRLSRKPLVLGVAGDSGAGKDFLVESLKDLFGAYSSVHISGDDYHLWDRHKPMWRVLTHLNPRANDLERFAKDLMALMDGKSIWARHYDHETGKMTLPMRKDSNDFILASGLHTLHLSIIRECLDLKMYLDIDEDLRRYFKIQRDVKVRGHTLQKVLDSLARREEDSRRFIQPQARYADIIFSLKPVNPKSLEDAADPARLRLMLNVITRNGFQEESLRRVLVGICGLHVDIAINGDGQIVMSIEGDVTGEDIQLAANNLFSDMQDFLAFMPKWHDGVSGLMQIVALSHINQVLSKRLI